MKIFWDIDETLIHSVMYTGKDYNDHSFIIDVYDELYYTHVRPCAYSLIEYSRGLVGVDNVYILTAAAERYARCVNAKAGWEFAEDHIIARETIERYTVRLPSLYSCKTIVSEHPLAHNDNILIDNLPPEYNNEKTTLLRVNPLINYFKVDDYVGRNFEDDIFRDEVKHFLKTRYEKIKNIGTHA